MNTTVRMKQSQITKDWHVIDAANRPLGRVASEAAILLRGKHKPTFERHLDGGDFVIIVNAAQVRVTGRKASQIKYYTHSGFPGGLKTRTYEEQLARFPERVLEQAVKGMLPKGTLGEAINKHLKVYKGPNHPHQSQITGSDKAVAAREAAQAAIGIVERKVPRLRPLSVPYVAPVAETIEPVAAPEPKKPATPRRGRAPKGAAAATVVTELAAQDATVLTSESDPPATAAAATVADAATPTPAEAAIAAAPRRARRKAAEPAAETPAVEGKKPTRSRTKAAPEPEAKPARAPRRKAVDGADATEKKPARRTTAKKREE